MRSLTKLTSLLILLVANATSAWATDGRVLSFEGDVRVNGQPVTTNTELNQNDTIITAAGASVKIVLSDNSVLDLDSDTEVQLSDFVYDPATPEENTSEVSVVEGTLRYVSGLIAKDDPDNVSFNAGNSTIGVRGSFTEIDVDGAVVNVEAMIGEATLEKEGVDGEKDFIVVPTGKTTQVDPKTGETRVETSTVSNRVNAVVRAIAAVSPDAASGSTGEGCSQGSGPLRRTARPRADAIADAAIAAQLAELSRGELMMVIAVLNNNARHLCIDSATVAATVGRIATVRPEEAGEAVFIATLLDNDTQYAEAALAAAPDQAASIERASRAAEEVRQDFPASQPTPSNGDAPPDPGVNPDTPETEVPPGGGEPASPE